VADWVLAVERAYVASATRGPVKRGGDAMHLPQARAAIGAVASHYLAVGTPRTLGLVVDANTRDAGALSLVAHKTWFAPREVRCTDGPTGVLATLDEVLACDIVCVHTAVEIRASQLRRGTHVNVLSSATIDDELRKIAAISEESRDLGALAAGLVDGRQLDEITVFFSGDLQIALGAF
jgi:hypothetical protein